ncbi:MULTISPECIES: CDP-alcohol phosphatidyltransferase family protein [unclassified Janibacter]|uniref:CDP-alcohol phosphatidyltransferase family protein n=1 Tax=unclassified Janibacter TaxID=2649294 RepID=UPI003CFCA75F
MQTEDRRSATDHGDGSGARVWTLPNVLSMLRLLLLPVFIWAIVGKHDGVALATLMLSGITDYLDGKIARTFGLESRFGAFLDPVADRLYILTSLLGLAYRDVIPWWLVALLIGRDAILTLVVARVRRHTTIPLKVHFIGKAATFNLLYAFPLLLMGTWEGVVGEWARPIGWAFAWWGAALYFLGLALYLIESERVIARVRGADGD